MKPAPAGFPLYMATNAVRALVERPTERVASVLEVGADGLAVIEIRGPLAHRQEWFRGYDQVGAEIDQAVRSAEVREIVLLLDSPGGEVSGCCDLSDRIYAARDEKPITALVDDTALSAAYALASAASRVLVSRTSEVGSVGVITMHADMSKALAKAGITMTEIFSGDRKADLSPFRPLSDGARARRQAEIDEVYELLVETVARNRGLTTKAVREQQAGVFMGAGAVTAGLADELYAFTSRSLG